ncbi:MAG TPA: FG-GAP-like repeat-containing protein [Planctomycetota bacterium]|nr:FG-GAP-like repeat-containing protein [Planctomycetota bacterium]
MGVRSFPPFVVLKNDGTGGFGPAPMVEFDPILDFVLTAGDLDGDGDVDVATAEMDRGDLSIWSNSGDGAFSFAASPEVFESTTGLALADIDGDDLLDVLRSGPGVGVLRNKGGFLLAPEVRFEPALLSYGIVSGDYDSDGKADIAVSPFAIDRVMVLYNTSPPSPPRDQDRDDVLDDCQETLFRRGDADASGQLNLADAVFLLASLFVGGEDPPCSSSADLNDSGTLDITDPIYILEFLFLGRAAPPAPFDGCGPDPTPDALDCDAFPSCGG